ncbi:MAG: hypothetical protein DIU52_009050 [bacterium]|jgi:hypothetical protein|nr:MAG: hypothetical protein DIU52_14720 [bacterium]
MRRLVLLLAAGFVVSAGCGGEIVVQAQLEGEDGAEPLTLASLPVRVLPYDRDALFDSLAAAYPVPEPTIPDSVMQLREQMLAAQAEWQRNEARWNEVRDSMRQLLDEMNKLSRTSGQYRVLYREFERLEDEERATNRAREAAFQRMSSLQSQLAAQLEEFRLKKEAWEDEAFAPLDSIIPALIKSLGREEVADTTDATGTVRVKVPKGRWWVHARYMLPNEELYWNVPVEVTGGDPLVVQLTRQNAQVRPRI